MTRAERRRLQKENKNKPVLPTKVFNNHGLEQLSKTTGIRIDSLKAWKAAYDKEMYEAYQKQCQDKLLLIEDTIAVGNIIASLLAIEKTWGFKKANSKFLDNFIDTVKYVEEVGLEKAYEEVKERMDIEIEFTPADVNKEFWFEEKI